MGYANLLSFLRRKGLYWITIKDKVYNSRSAGLGGLVLRTAHIDVHLPEGCIEKFGRCLRQRMSLQHHRGSHPHV